MTQSETFRIRRADEDDIEPIIALLDEASGWLADRGLDQWQNARERRRLQVHTDMAERTVHVVEHVASGVATVVATITLDELADADFWTDADDVRSALYAHRMAVARDWSGIGLGAAMLDWAAGRAHRCGRTKLRLDAWRTNGALHQFYKNLFFDVIRDRDVGRGSGMLFERPVLLRSGSGPELVELPAVELPAVEFAAERAALTAASVPGRE